MTSEPTMEIERKFLVTSDDWRPLVRKDFRVIQGYLSFASETSQEVRVRATLLELAEGREKIDAYLTVKSSGDIVRSEVEFMIDQDKASELLKMVQGNLIDKTRHHCFVNGQCFEVDVFHGALAGLVTAEIELPSEDAVVDLPSWLGAEVSLDKRYKNASMAVHGKPSSAPVRSP